MLRRAQQSGGSQTFQNVPNQQCRDFHPTWKFRAGTVPRLPAGRWCWWPTMVLVGKLRSTSSIHNDGAAMEHFGAKAQSHGGARTIHTVTHTDGKSGTRLLSIEGEIGSGGNVGAVSSRNQTKFQYGSYKLGRSGAVQIFTFSCVQNPRLQCLVFKWASLSH